MAPRSVPEILLRCNFAIVIEIISATRSNKNYFSATPLGISLQRMKFDIRLSAQIAYSNSDGLPSIYNRRIEAKSDSSCLSTTMFGHDYFLADRIIDGLSRYDLIGVAGNRRVPKEHVGWLMKNDQREWDEPENRSGAVAHNRGPFGPVTPYGASPASCELLDGVLLAANKSVLINTDVRFDPSFKFHFYDLDFCRSARSHGLRLGTWPIAITHTSGGGFGSPPWQTALDIYKKKWPRR